MKLDAAQVRHPRERGSGVWDREPVGMSARELHEDVLDVRGVVRGHPLLVEEVLDDPVREALHVERPPAQMRESELGDADVVGNEVELRQAPLGEEDLCRVGDRNLVAAYSHARSIVEPCWKDIRPQTSRSSRWTT